MSELEYIYRYVSISLNTNEWNDFVQKTNRNYEYDSLDNKH